MALSIHVTDNCKYLTVNINYTTTSSVTVNLSILDYNGVNIAGTLTPSFTVTSGSAPINYPIPVDDLDCCLTKLTNELLECACDCLKCNSVLAKAQKIFLLIKSADYALSQINVLNPGSIAGYLLDAQNKYTKAKEICDESCGCDC